MPALLLLFAKSYVPGHTRRLKNGKVVQVNAYYDKRTKKAAQHAPDHSHDVGHLADADKAKFSQMHKEQHMTRFYVQHALERKLDGERQLLANLQRSAKRHEAAGDKKSVTLVHNKIIRLKQSIMRHEKMLDKAKAVVGGIGEMKEGLVKGSGKIETPEQLAKEIESKKNKPHFYWGTEKARGGKLRMPTESEAKKLTDWKKRKNL